MTTPSVAIRERRPEDVPVLCEVLAAQQAAANYPVRWPLPIPIEDFLVRPGEERAWVAEVDGRVVGHVGVYTLGGPLRDEFAAGAGTDELAELAVLFVGGEVVGTGVGGLLLDTAVAWIRASGRQPVLDVVAAHERVMAIYLHRGWTVIGETHVPFLGPDETVFLMTLSDRR